MRTHRLAYRAAACLGLALGATAAVAAHGITPSHAEPKGPPVESVTRPAEPAGTTVAQREARARQYFTDNPLQSSDGRTLRFFDDVLRNHVVLVSFIYTNCAEACPMITHTKTVVKRELGELFGREVRFVSLSIDPARDTPAEMARFAARYDATHPEWLWLTGRKADIDPVLKKLGAFTPDPQTHFTGMYIGNVRADRWRRVRPDAPAKIIAAEIRSMLEAAPLAAAR